MAVQTRKVDAKSRVVLPEQFAGKMVAFDLVGNAEIRIRIVREPRWRPSFDVLMSGVTDENLPEKVDFGPPMGEELI